MKPTISFPCPSGPLPRRTYAPALSPSEPAVGFTALPHGQVPGGTPTQTQPGSCLAPAPARVHSHPRPRTELAGLHTRIPTPPRVPARTRALWGGHPAPERPPSPPSSRPPISPSSLPLSRACARPHRGPSSCPPPPHDAGQALEGSVTPTGSAGSSARAKPPARPLPPPLPPPLERHRGPPVAGRLCTIERPRPLLPGRRAGSHRACRPFRRASRGAPPGVRCRPWQPQKRQVARLSLIHGP